MVSRLRTPCLSVLACAALLAASVQAEELTAPLSVNEAGAGVFEDGTSSEQELSGAGDELPPLDDSRYGASRGRVIRAYLTFLSRARDAGYEIAAHLTPGEIELRVRQPEGPLAELTGVFLDARYGPDEPSAEAVRIAESSTRTLTAFLARRPRPRLRLRSRPRP